jgi:hypothetical protein
VRRAARGSRWGILPSISSPHSREGARGLAALATRLQDEGASSFVKSWKDLMACIDSKSAAVRKAA